MLHNTRIIVYCGITINTIASGINFEGYAINKDGIHVPIYILG